MNGYAETSTPQGEFCGPCAEEIAQSFVRSAWHSNALVSEVCRSLGLTHHLQSAGMSSYHTISTSSSLQGAFTMHTYPNLRSEMINERIESGVCWAQCGAAVLLGAALKTGYQETMMTDIVVTSLGGAAIVSAARAVRHRRRAACAEQILDSEASLLNNPEVTR